jgi:hypothetical protein
MKVLLLIFTLTLWSAQAVVKKKAPKKEGNVEKLEYFSTPMHEIMQNDIYVGLTADNEYAVTYSGKGADMQPDDFITHADSIKLLTGSLEDFLLSGNEIRNGFCFFAFISLKKMKVKQSIDCLYYVSLQVYVRQLYLWWIVKIQNLEVQNCWVL